MQAASFVNIFVGIETPNLDALKSMRKEQNATLPMMDSIRTLNGYGMEVTSGHHPGARHRHRDHRPTN